MTAPYRTVPLDRRMLAVHAKPSAHLTRSTQGALSTPLTRERTVLLKERVRHVNRVKGLLASQGIIDYEPLRQDRRDQLDTLRTGDGRPLPSRLKAELLREIEVIELLMRQIREVEAERDAIEPELQLQDTPIALLARLKAIGPQIATVLHVEGLYRSFSNRREVAAYAGLVPTPWRSGKIDREQGISKAGNRRLRTVMIELAWLWVRHHGRAWSAGCGAATRHRRSGASNEAPREAVAEQGLG